MAKGFQKIRKALTRVFQAASFSPEQEEEIDFLDSSASSQLKKNCLAFFSQDQIDEFNNYENPIEIGRGSMGIVYKATHRRERKQYALKVLPANMVNDPQVAQSFFQEICIQSSLQHENIIRLHKVGIKGQTIFIVMEYVVGNDLETLVRKRGYYPQREALQIVEALAQALVYASEKKVVHRDLKPANILLEVSSQTPKIADFGLAKLASKQKTPDYAFGTPAYMAPEQIVSSKSVDQRADIYALGSILYHLLSGQRPYAQIQDPVTLLSMKQKQDPTPLSTWMENLDPRIETLVKKAMARKPRSRYQKAKDFHRDCQKVLAYLEEKLPPGYKKSPLTPSQVLQEEALNLSSQFVPIEENPDLFMTATRPEVSNVLNTFAREVEQFKNSPLGEILQAQEKEEEKPEESGENDFESTLVSMTMLPDAAIKIPNPLLKRLLQAKGNNLLKIILQELKQAQLPRTELTILTELRYLLILRGNTITKEPALLNYLNQGQSKLDLKLEEMSRITPSAPFNKKVRLYFHDLVDSLLKEHDEVFRRRVQACKNTDEITCYLKNYSLQDKSLFRKYKNLQIISALQNIHNTTIKDGAKLPKLIKKYLPSRESSIQKKLLYLYAQKGDESTLWGAISRSHSLPVLVQHLVRLKEDSELKKMAGRVHQLINVFMDAGGQTSLENFKTSLNFLPAQQQGKIHQLMRKYLASELQQKAQAILVPQKGNEKRLVRFLNLLQNPRYDDKRITIYGYTARTFGSKVKKLQQGEKIEEVFSKPIAQEVLALVYQNREMEVAAHKRSLENCVHELKLLAHKAKRQQFHLVKCLLGILHDYGKFNFARENSEKPLTGYQLSRYIVRSLNGTSNSKLELPSHLRPEISQLIQSMLKKKE